MTITSSQYLDMIAKANQRVMANDAAGAEAIWDDTARVTGFDPTMIAADTLAYSLFGAMQAAGIKPDYMRLLDGYRMLKANEPKQNKPRFKKRQ